MHRHGARRLQLEKFRNYETLSIELSPGFNVLVGVNAQGKTNLLEALYLLATTRLLRGQRDAEAILDGHETSVCAAELIALNTEIAIQLQRGIRKRAMLNGLALPRASDLIGRMPAVSFSSEDLAIVRGEPADRRLFLDLELSGLQPAYLRSLTLYKRALDQRNALLRESRELMQPAASFDPWEAQIAHHGQAIRTARASYVDGLADSAKEAHGRLAGGERLELRYLQRDEGRSEEEIYSILDLTRHNDVMRGATTVGPHRDDISIEVDGRDARLFGSQGQQRTAVIAIKMAAMERAKAHLGMPPLLLLDDIFSDLDEHRKAMLVESVDLLGGQTVLTTTDTKPLGRALLSEAKLFGVDGGTVNEL